MSVPEINPGRKFVGLSARPDLAPRASIVMTYSILSAGVVLFLIACCLPALEFKNSNSSNDIMFGLRALAVGWSGIFAAIFAWFANPLWLIGAILLCLRKPVLGGTAGLIAVALAWSTFSIVGMELPGDEGNVTRTTVIRLLPGFYLWMASMASLPAAATFSFLRF